MLFCCDSSIALSPGRAAGQACGLSEHREVLVMDQVVFISSSCLICPQAQHGHVEASLLAHPQPLLSVLTCSCNDHFRFHPLESSDN